MRPTIPLLIFGVLGCSSGAEPTAPGLTTYRSYRTWNAAAVHSTLVEQAQPQHHTLRGHTQLQDGTWLMEQVTLSNEGRLLRAEIDRGGPCADQATHIIVDAEQGKVELDTAGIYQRWTVPTDLPWVPVGLIATETSGHDLATPIGMTIALRSARAERAARLVDIQHFTSATIMQDQLLVDEGDSEPTVVLGDDYADIEGDLPARLHLAAFDCDLDAQAPDLTAAWARLRCERSNEGTAL